ncbi:hypothetical protein Sjap_022389 [Stephania japonica]|uniref:Inactive heme oxygenase 2, chloroplastic n=1 Tax=Stephania japonica TaxID=461633 RepID=A0AAP0ERX6_9MAGN
MSSPTTAPRYSRHLLEEMPLLLPSQLLCNSIVSLHPFLPNPKNTNGFFSPLCCSSSTTTAAATAPTASTNAGAAPVIRKRKRYRKLCPGESKGIVEEMRFVTMRLYTNNNSSTTTTSNSNGNSGGDGDESGIEDNNNEFDDCDGVEETWMPTIEGFVKYLVDSELVFHTIERIVDESDNIAYTYFRQTGLERLESLSKDLEWLEQQGISIPEPSSPGVSYAQYLEELAEKSAPLFLCHFYNIYFAHISGGQVITKQVCEKLLEGKDLELCRWEGNVPELLKEVREKLNKLGEAWSRDEKNKCLRETTKSFKFLGQIVRLIIL